VYNKNGKNYNFMKGSLLRNDKFRKARGGYARWLDLQCEHCGAFIARYQKDGSGPLKRLYIDRLAAPPSLANLRHVPVGKLPVLTCSRCKRQLGVPILYAKERRPAFRLFAEAVTKK
jgi:hypothetical protein